MKTSMCIALVLLPLVSEDVKASSLVEITNRFEKLVWTCELEDAEVAKAPKWERRLQDMPPLPPGKAMRIAEKYVEILLDDSLAGGTGVGAVAIEATLQGVGPNEWIYVVKVVAGRNGSSGNPPLQIVVMMDGQIPKYVESTR